jgi:hypothetical protein
MKTIQNTRNKIALAVAALATSGMASAAVDVSELVSENSTGLIATGMAVMGIVVAIAAFAWSRRVVK